MDSEEGKESIDSIFYLKRADTDSTLAIQVDFSPLPSDAPPQNINSSGSIPVFNRDSKYFTPSFILNID